MTSPTRKAERLLQLEVLLFSHPEGLSQAEIARRLQVNRSTINRYYPDLPKHIYVEDDKWKIDRHAYLVNVRFNLDEAMAVHLATRLLATRMERQNQHAASALRKLGAAMERLAPRISRHMLQSADAMDDPGQKQDPNFLRSMEILTQAWAELRKVKVWHRQEKQDEQDGEDKKTGRDRQIIKEYVMAPYFIEPYAIGQSTYVIGWREPPGDMRTLKIERIERVELLNERYTIPEDFNPAELLKDAWGIWFTDDDPVEVVLKFSPRVAQRVGETRWHRSEEVTEQEDGSLLWRAKIAEPQEMMPWIRGWGADVEVLKPEKVRQKMVEEVERLCEIYR